MATVFGLLRGEEGGSVTVNDVRTYLTSAFRVMFKLKPGLEEHVSVFQPHTIIDIDGRLKFDNIKLLLRSVFFRVRSATPSTFSRWHSFCRYVVDYVCQGVSI